jgi:hypothetical protein
MRKLEKHRVTESLLTSIFPHEVGAVSQTPRCNRGNNSQKQCVTDIRLAFSNNHEKVSVADG